MIDRSLARILGFLMGDGCLYKCRERLTPRENHREHGSRVGYAYRIEFYNKNQHLLSQFSKDILKVFGKRPVFNPKKYRVRISSNKYIFEYLKGLADFGSHKWKIPIDSFNRESALEWLCAFIDCEGYVEYDKKNRHKRIVISSVNHDGLLQIQNLLLKFFNVSSKIYKHYKNYYHLIVNCSEINSKIKDFKLNHPDKNRLMNFLSNN